LGGLDSSNIISPSFTSIKEGGESSSIISGFGCFTFFVDLSIHLIDCSILGYSCLHLKVFPIILSFFRSKWFLNQHTDFSFTKMFQQVDVGQASFPGWSFFYVMNCCIFSTTSLSSSYIVSNENSLTKLYFKLLHSKVSPQASSILNNFLGRPSKVFGKMWGQTLSSL